MNIPLPEAKIYPRNITNNAKVKRLWSSIVNKYKETIRASGDVEDQWATSIALFNTASIKLGYIPFDFDQDKTMINKIVKDLDKRANKIKELLDAFTMMLEVSSFVGKWSSEKVKEITKTKNDFNIYTERYAYLDDIDDKESLQEIIKDQGFRKSKDRYIRKVNVKDNIIMRFTPKRLYLYPHLTLSEDHSKLITLKREEKEIKEQLKKGINNWIKTSQFRI